MILQAVKWTNRWARIQHLWGETILSVLSGRKPSLVGLDISPSAVKMLELSFDGEGYVVENYGAEPLPENTIVEQNIVDLEAVSHAIRQLKKSTKFNAKLVAVAVAGSSVITKTIEVPATLKDNQIEEQLLLDADQYIPYPLDEVAMDFQVLGPSPRSSQMVDVLIAACRREHIESREAAIEMAGLVPEVIDIEAHCVQRAMALDLDLFTRDLSKGLPDILAIVDIGADMMCLSVLAGSQVVYTREQMFGGKQLTEEIQRTYGLPLAEAGYKKKFGVLPDDYEKKVLNPYKDALVQHVMRSLQFFYSATAYNDVDRIVLAGGTANLSGLDEIIERKLGTPVSVANPFDNMRIADKVDVKRLIGDAPAMMIACGLAMRGLGFHVR